MVERSLDRLGIDELGLVPHAREMLRVLREAGRPLGPATLAKPLSESVQSLPEVYLGR